MSEVACYSLDVPIDELFVGMSAVPDRKRSELITNCKGFLGANPDAGRGVCHFLYDTPKHRDEAYIKVSKKLMCFINQQTCYVNKKYLKGG